MDMKRLLTNLSAKILTQFAVVIAVIIALMAFNFDSIYPFYAENQLTSTGLIINGAIITLFLLGIGSILLHLLRYRREEACIATFINNVEATNPDFFQGVPVDSIIAQRHGTMRTIHSANAEINHSALAAMLNADETTQFGLIRFINNILILTGVFGTIVSLSIALIGASDLIDSAGASLGGMGLVIHGMSTALSTTITAIVSYGIFGYFYTRLGDVQTHCLSGIEQLTSIYLMPRYAKRDDDIVHDMSDLIKSVNLAADKLKQTQETYHDTAVLLQQTIANNQQQADRFADDMVQIRQILREGFRLTPDGNDKQL
ncbi:MAG: hypothetical protein ACJAUP_000444 [Cellvibrionaceae bacterium]|jgi:hypothetical protein